MLTLDANIWVAAYDPQDRFHVASTAFLRVVAERGLRIYGPAFLAVEVACAVARRAQSQAAGEIAGQWLQANPLLEWQPLDEQLLTLAAQLGVRQLLRGADALYVATAVRHQTPLISWDVELVQRVGAIQPDDWMAANSL